MSYSKILNKNIPKGLNFLLSEQIVKLTPWRLLKDDSFDLWFNEYQTKYPGRKIIPFAARYDDDVIACFDEDEPEKIFVLLTQAPIYDDVIKTYDDFWSWFKQCINNMIEFANESELE
jgi:hypothetical protein